VARAGAARLPGSAGAVDGEWHDIGPDGSLGKPRSHEVGLSPEELRELYRLMAVGRRLDRQATNLVRQGALGVYASSRGQEACQVGAVAALEEQDWLFPTYRDSVAAWTRGLDMADVLALFAGIWHSGWNPLDRRVAPLTTPLATHLAHAAGLAMAAKLRGDPLVALALFGDGAASEGDSHEAMNLAGAASAPCVFVLQNNQYAISVPARVQSGARTLALRAAGLGIPGALVDGNDVVSVLGCVREAVERARSGGGPTLVEAVTYRLDPHTNADDPRRYRSDEEVTRWLERDPVDRLRRQLEEQDALPAGFLEAVDAEGERLAAALRERLFGAPAGDPLEMFDHVYAAPPPQLRRQRAELAAILEAEAEAELGPELGPETGPGGESR